MVILFPFSAVTAIPKLPEFAIGIIPAGDRDKKLMK